MGIYLKSDGFRLGFGGPAGIQVMREPNFAAGEGCAVLLCSLQEFQQTKQTANPISSSTGAAFAKFQNTSPSQTARNRGT